MITKWALNRYEQMMLGYRKPPKKASKWWYVALVILLFIACGLVMYAKGIDKGRVLENESMKRAIKSHSAIEIEGQKWVSVWHRVENR